MQSQKSLAMPEAAKSVFSILIVIIIVDSASPFFIREHGPNYPNQKAEVSQSGQRSIRYCPNCFFRKPPRYGKRVESWGRFDFQPVNKSDLKHEQVGQKLVGVSYGQLFFDNLRDVRVYLNDLLAEFLLSGHD